MLIRADRDDHVPQQTASGLVTATSLAAAVEGADPADSWFVGTIVQLGPLVNRIDVRQTVLRWLREIAAGACDDGTGWCPVDLRTLRHRIEAIPQETPDPLRVGDRVTFSWAAGQQITIATDRFLILRASEILAVVEDEHG